MGGRSKELRDNVLKSLVMLYACEHDELKGYELLHYEVQDNAGNISITAILKKIGRGNELKATTLDLKAVTSLLVDIVISEVWGPLLEWGVKNVE